MMGRVILLRIAWHIGLQGRRDLGQANVELGKAARAPAQRGPRHHELGHRRP